MVTTPERPLAELPRPPAPPSPSMPSGQPARRAPRRVRLATPALTLLLVAWAAALAQPEGAAPDGRLVALHYQDLLADEEGVVDLFVPPPALEEWNELHYAAEGCLVIEDVLTGPPDKAVVVRLRMPEPGSCVTLVELRFGDGSTSWPASALVAVTRLPDLPTLGAVWPTFRRVVVDLPWRGAHERQMADFVQIGVENTLDAPFTILGLGNDAAFAQTMGTAFLYDPTALPGSYAELQRNGAPFEATTLAPGESVGFGLVLDPERRLPSGAATLTFRPVMIVEMAGALYTLPLSRVASAWGTGLP